MNGLRRNDDAMKTDAGIKKILSLSLRLRTSARNSFLPKFHIQRTDQ
jgi:hypothetical protein